MEQNKEESFLPGCLVVILMNFISQLQHSGLGCHVGTSYAGAFGYADGIALVAPSMQCLRKMIIMCEKYAKLHSITFNPNKPKLLCFNVDDTDVIPQIYLNGEVILVVDSNKHLGNYISTNITDSLIEILLTTFVIYIREVIESLVILEYAIVMH